VNHLLIGISAALGALVVVLAALLVVHARRSSRQADARVDEVMNALETRMDELARELADAVERAEDEAHRNQFLDGIAMSIDLDDVLARTLEAATALPGADAALVRLDAADGTPLVSALGLDAEEAERHALAGPPDGRTERSIELVYGYPEDASSSEDLLHAGLAVPLPDEGARLGYLAVFTREAGRRFDESDLRGLEDLARRAGPAIANGRRFREARRLADIDALTGLHNRRYFYETLAREVARAHRYDRRLALIVLDLDGFKDINDRIGHLAGDGVLAEAAARVLGAVRSADIACRVGGDEFAVILPESGLDQAQRLASRIQIAVSSRPLGAAGRVQLSAGVAELQPQDDSGGLFERADKSLYSSKEGPEGLPAAGEPTY
jgi:diguanylate cyclase (GGDEF)-like protein